MIIAVMVLILSFLVGCSIFSTDAKYEKFAEDAAKQIISETLRSPSSAIWNEVSYLEDNGNGSYIVYIDVEATNGFGAYIRSRFFVIVKNINLEKETFSHSKHFSYIECKGKQDTYNLSLIKKFNDYDEPSNNNVNNGESNSDNNNGNDQNVENVTVSFISDNKIIRQMKVKKNSQITDAPHVQKDNYKFIGWFLSDQEIAFPYTVNQSINLLAKWEGVECEYFVINNGIETKYKIKYGDEIYIEPPIAKTGYKFLGWYNGTKKLTDATGRGVEIWKYNYSIRIEPKYELITNNVTYKTTTGGMIKYQGCPSGTYNATFELSILNNYTAPTITAVANNGYRFVKWSDGNTNVSRTDENLRQDKTLTAEFVRTYELTFVAGEGGTIQGKTNQVVDEGKRPSSVTAVANEGYEFDRWEYVRYQTTLYYRSETITPDLNDIGSLAGMEYKAIFRKIE